MWGQGRGGKFVVIREVVVLHQDFGRRGVVLRLEMEGKLSVEANMTDAIGARTA